MCFGVSLILIVLFRMFCLLLWLPLLVGFFLCVFLPAFSVWLFPCVSQGGVADGEESAGLAVHSFSFFFKFSNVHCSRNAKAFVPWIFLASAAAAAAAGVDIDDVI